MATKSTKSYRNVKVAFDNAAEVVDGSEVAQIAAPIDAFKAALGIVERLEGEYAKIGADVADLTAAPILASGSIPFQLHVFDVTSVMETGVYTFIYVETVPTSEDVA